MIVVKVTNYLWMLVVNELLAVKVTIAGSVDARS